MLGWDANGWIDTGFYLFGKARGWTATSVDGAFLRFLSRLFCPLFGCLGPVPLSYFLFLLSSALSSLTTILTLFWPPPDCASSAGSLDTGPTVLGAVSYWSALNSERQLPEEGGGVPAGIWSY